MEYLCKQLVIPQDYEICFVFYFLIGNKTTAELFFVFFGLAMLVNIKLFFLPRLILPITEYLSFLQQLLVILNLKTVYVSHFVRYYYLKLLQIKFFLE